MPDQKLWSVDWHALFVPQHSLLEMVVRGTIMYLAIFGLLRVAHKRQTGGISPADVLVIVLIAEVAGNAFSSAYNSVVEGLVLVCTVLFWSYVLEWLAHRSPAVERLLREPKLKLVAEGRMLRTNMRRELITEEELMAQLRKQGVDDCRIVKSAYMEADGTVSVIERQG